MGIFSGVQLSTVEAYSKWSNLAQLTVGFISVLAYITILVIQLRFFPIQVFTEGGEQLVQFRPALYHTLQLVQGCLSIVSAILFLGRDSFCVSKRVMVNNRPAHQVCYDWAYGMRVSIFFSLASSGVSVAGLFLSITELNDATNFTCINVMSKEFLCDGSLEQDAVEINILRNQLQADFTVSCLEKSIRTIVPLIYTIIYAITVFLGLLGAHSAAYTYRFFMQI
uniref:Uncharacterized protein n=1 Tax=Hemiselmis tepida TaxID=464990 RepID=A0A7S0VY11_9CRYP|mmetsp:Transcript_2422/g.6159  ORF Transcript_2422/g.6159 Transcript_2422/m.6159 type:complete len:224 (+) Transcript_2422:58-729(+)